MLHGCTSQATLPPNADFVINYPTVVEIQIHLKEIKSLKDEDHILYRIQRADTIADLRSNATPESSA